MLLFRYFTCSVQLKFISCITLQKFSSVFFYIKHFLGPNDQSPKDDTLVGQVLGCGHPLCNGPQSSSFQIGQIGLFSSALWLKNWSTKPQESHFRLGRLVGALCDSKYLHNSELQNVRNIMYFEVQNSPNMANLNASKYIFLYRYRTVLWNKFISYEVQSALQIERNSLRSKTRAAVMWN